jgi:hypothetical protein
LLKQLEHHREFRNDHQQINNAREEAEALFRSKPRLVEPSPPADPPQTEASVRKPRILSASPLPVTRMTAEAPIISKPQPKPPVSASQMAHAHRERLKRARAAIFKQRGEPQARKNTIDSELRAIDAYEAAKRR